MPAYLDEYLIRLGANIDSRAMTTFHATLQRASRSVTDHVGGMAGTVLKGTAAIVGAFASVSAAIVAVADSAATADQKYRLMGLHMLMTKDAAMELDMVTKGLGATLAEIRFDRELGLRATPMLAEIRQMNADMLKAQPNYARNMVGLRDIQIEFVRLGQQADFLKKSFSSALFEKLFPVGSTALQKFDHLVTNLQNSIPKIADELATDAVPVLKTTWEMLKAIGEALKGGAWLFQELVGVISGDKALQDAPLSFHSISLAIQDVEAEITKLMGKFRDAEAGIGHFALSADALRKGKLSEAASQADLALYGEPATIGIGPKAASIGRRGGLIKPPAEDGSKGGAGGGFDWKLGLLELGGLGMAWKAAKWLTPDLVKTGLKGAGRLAWRGLSSPFRVGGIGSATTTYEGFGGAAGAAETAGAGASAGGAAGAGAAAAETGAAAGGAGLGAGLMSFLVPVVVAQIVDKLLDATGATHVGGFILPPGLPTLTTKLHELLHPSEKGEKPESVSPKAAGTAPELRSDSLAQMPTATFWAGLERLMGGCRTAATTTAASGGFWQDVKAGAVAIGGNIVDRIANAITRVESGGKDTAISLRQNNPGNLRSWGNYPIEHGFVHFPTMAEGIAAEKEQIRKNISRGLNLDEFFAGKQGVYAGYAPSSDRNKPYAYASTVAQLAGIDTQTPLNRFGEGAAASPWQAPAMPDIREYQRPPEAAPRLQTINVNFGDIKMGGISITQPNASWQEIRSRIDGAVKEALDDQVRKDLVQMSPMW